MESFFARVGGKSRLSKQIAVRFPAYETYCEPFCGAGSVFLRTTRCPTEVLNDVDSNIMALWRDMKHCGESLAHVKFVGSKPQFETWMTTIPLDAETRLFRNLYISKFSFAGNRRTYAPSHTRRTNIGSRLKKNCLLYKQRLQGVHLECTDYTVCIEKWDSPTTLFYLDPPFETGTISNWNYKPLNRETLREVLRNMKGMFVMSYENTTEIRAFFREFNQHLVYTSYTSGNRQKFKNLKVGELLISNCTLK